MIDLHTPYISFDRQQWADLRNAVPLTLDESDIEKLRGINERLTLEEVQDIYLPLCRMLNLYVKARQSRTEVTQQFIGEQNPYNVPYIVGIAGSVAVGKSTIARLLKTLLERWPEHSKVELVTTDGFLYPNKVLNERGLMQKKGFPESYDMRRLMQFVCDVKSCKPRVEAPIYSHSVYDITDEVKVIEQPNILILEGLNVLQTGIDYPEDPMRVFVSDFLDFSIYVDAKPDLLKTWYINRFLTLRQGAFQNPNSYFHHFTKLSDDDAVAKASNVWDEINGKNLVENIFPTRERAELILEKGENHSVRKVKLRK